MPSPTQTIGAALEQTAETILSRRGYQVVARNWRGAGGELDRVAWDGACLCFIEVRYRGRDDTGTALETVGPAKRRILVRVARAYLAAHFPDAHPDARFDVVGLTRQVSGELSVEVVTNAFDERGRPL